MKTVEMKFLIDGINLTTTSDWEEDELLDTMIYAHPKGKLSQKTYITTIAGENIHNFLEDFETLLKTYKI